MAFQEDQNAVVKSVIDRAALVAAALGISVADVEVTLEISDSFLATNLKALADKEFILSISFDKQGGQALTLKTVQDAVGANTPLILVSAKLGHISSTGSDLALLTSFSRTQSTGTLEVIWRESVLRYIVAGRLMHEEQLISGSKKQLASQKWIRAFSELTSILNDHMEAAIKDEQLVRYWKDKTKRILLAGPDGTEKLFHGSLFWWLNNFLEDKLVVFAGASSFGQNSTDITVVTTGQAIYLIEVKWLGKNEKKTEYQQSQINVGLVQVKTYLDKDNSLMAGYLVIYDGRAENIHKTQCGWSNKHLHARCREPYIFFLESLTPSQIAKKTIN